MSIQDSSAAQGSEVVSGVLVPAAELSWEQQVAEQLMEQAKSDGIKVATS